MIYNGDSSVELKQFEENCVHSIVTDPPYGLSFLNHKWDYDVPPSSLWEECFRVLKPGGFLLAFASARTYHRMAINIEDAGFEIRDQIMWVYSTGFPKNRMLADGIGLALKPAHEPIVLARKPFKGTAQNNYDQHGTGLSIDECRVGNEVRTKPIFSDDVKDDTTLFGLHPTIQHERVESSQGRFPSNLIHDGSDDVRALFPDAVSTKIGDGDTSAARFYYCAKPSKKEKQGCTHPTMKPIKLMEYLVKLVTPKDGTCLDPFMGSGTTGVACKNTGRQFIGIEKDPDYFQLATTRINGTNHLRN